MFLLFSHSLFFPVADIFAIFLDCSLLFFSRSVHSVYFLLGTEFRFVWCIFSICWIVDATRSCIERDSVRRNRCISLMLFNVLDVKSANEIFFSYTTHLLSADCVLIAYNLWFLTRKIVYWWNDGFVRG